MKIWKTLCTVVGCAGFALALSAPGANAQVNAMIPPDVDFNHLECYKATDVRGATFNFDLQANDTNFLPPNTLQKNCRMRRRAVDLCIDTRTQSLTPTAIGDEPSLTCADGSPCTVDGAQCADDSYCTTNPRTSVAGDIPNAWDYLCYKVICDKGSQPGRGVSVTVKDRFGERLLKVRRAWKVCVPILDKSS